MQQTRRTFLKASAVGATATVAGVAGCLESPLDSSDEVDGDGYAAFFALTAWGNAVGGEHFSFDDPVGTGRMGHGWDPDADVIPEIAESDLFLYLDTDEFSWAQNIVTSIEQDYEGQVETVDVLDGMEPFFIPFSGDRGGEATFPTPDYDHEFRTADLGLDNFEIWDLRDTEQLGYWHAGHWHGFVPDVPEDSFVPVGIVLRDTNERVVPLDLDGRYWVDARVADGESAIVEIESRGDHIEIHGQETGSTAIVFEFYEGDELIYETTADPADFDVVDEEPDYEIFDPHLWVDPVLAQQMVENIAETVIDLDPEHEDAYRENADAYTTRLEDVHQQIQTVVDEATLDTVIFAGHDSFRYLERRYDFTLETPVGVTPDAAESQEDIIRLLDIIEREGIDTVLYDPFESPDPEDEGSLPRMVQTIFENSDVHTALPLTPVEGTTATWEENGWGWVEQMEEINIPALERALNPE